MSKITLKKDQKRNLIFFIRYNEDKEKNEVIIINKWYWIGTKQIRQMSDEIVSFACKTLKCKKEVKPCLYLTKMDVKEIEEKLISEGLSVDPTLSSVRFD